MADIVLADDGIAFTGRTPEERPLGGAESAVVQLAEALAARGHQVRGFTNVDPNQEKVEHNGVTWTSVHAGGSYAALPDACDLYVANRGDKLIPRVPNAGRSVFWVHNPAGYIVKPRYIWKLLKRRPVIVFIGEYHATTCPSWIPTGGRRTIPYGVADAFRTAAVPSAEPPGPRAIFTSNPLRGLDWLVDVWTTDIHPHVPAAELHAFAGAATYGAAGDRKAGEMARVLDAAAAAPGVRLRDPIPKADLIPELLASRVMLYRGDENETFCAALAEAQALGVPCVVERRGSTPERVIDGTTGAVVMGREAFAQAAVRVLQDDALWRSYHDAALTAGRAWSWDDAAAAFEDLL